MSSITLAVAAQPVTLPCSGVKALGAPADIVVTATPVGGGAPISDTLPAAPDGPWTLSFSVPAGQYTVVASTTVTLSATATASFP